MPREKYETDFLANKDIYFSWERPKNGTCEEPKIHL